MYYITLHLQEFRNYSLKKLDQCLCLCVCEKEGGTLWKFPQISRPRENDTTPEWLILTAVHIHALDNYKALYLFSYIQLEIGVFKESLKGRY